MKAIRFFIDGLIILMLECLIYPDSGKFDSFTPFITFIWMACWIISISLIAKEVINRYEIKERSSKQEIEKEAQS